MRCVSGLAVLLCALAACGDSPKRASSDPPDTVRCTVEADGRYALVFREQPLLVSRLALRDPAARAAECRAIAYALAQAMTAGGHRDPSGRSTLTLHLALAPTIPWRIALELVQAGTHWYARVERFTLSVAGDDRRAPLDVRGDGLGDVWGGVAYADAGGRFPRDRRSSALTLGVRGGTCAGIESERSQPLSSEPGDDLARYRWVREQLGSPLPDLVKIRVWSPDVSAACVLGVIHAARAAGPRYFHFPVTGDSFRFR